MSALPNYLPQELPEVHTLPYTEMPLEEETGFPIRAYFKYELAELYGVSVPTLVKWIQFCLPELEALGYHKRMQKLTPKMVKVLVESVG